MRTGDSPNWPGARSIRYQRGERHRIPRVRWLVAALLVLADALARTVIAPRELTAMLGVPMMLWLLGRPRTRPAPVLIKPAYRQGL